MSSLSYRTQRVIVVVGFLGIPLVLLFLFTYYPAIRMLYLSFTNYNGYSAAADWIGLDNYRTIFTNPDFFGVFLNQVSYVIVGIVQNIVALLFAVVLNSRMKGRNFFRVILFLPFIMNGVAVSYMFQYVYDTSQGSLNLLLGFLGLESLQRSWLGDVNIVNYSLASIGFWRFMGYNMVIYLAGLQSLPNDMYEAARIDGAGRFRMVWSLTLPNMTKIVQLNMFLTLSGALSVFEYPFVLTKGGPVGASETFLLKTLETAFQFNNFGLASAMSVVLLFFVVILVLVQNRVIEGRRGRE
jgi:multiple sugar transport system permease protein